MVSQSSSPKISSAHTHHYFYQALTGCRQETLALATSIPSKLLKRQAHPDFSPIGWHLGHIAYTESLWISEYLGKERCQFPQYTKLFAADGLPKEQRENLPNLSEIISFLEVVRQQSFEVLAAVDLSVHARLWHWLLQHECQHVETMAMVLALHNLRGEVNWPKQASNNIDKKRSTRSSTIFVEAGRFIQGSNSPIAIDNEKPAHSVWLDSYEIDRTPVTCGQYQQFIEAGGYWQKQWWTAAGWEWQQKAKVEAPLYWMSDRTSPHQPVYGVNWYEADAYARFVGKRLPTESEWAKAITLNMIGGVWEWTSTWFDAYPGFEPFPYAGYSQIYFDRQHRVLRGGSFATPRWAMRHSFRNWYHPHRREMFAGFRCAA